MIDLYKKIPDPKIPCLLLRPAEACVALGMARSTLDANLHPKGLCVPHFRIGRRRFLDVESLKQWAQLQIEKQAAERGESST